MLNAVVGFAGLPATLAALEAGKRLALANKESLIAGGPGRREGAAPRAAARSCRSTASTRRCGSACGPGDPSRSRSIVLTASGGPFRGRRRAELAAVGRADALAHPTWNMGAKITIDSSTLMNKGLEVIEAHELFGVDFDRIEVVVHPQSVVHGMVEFSDGATIAQLSMPDMRLPIGLALGAPDRLDEPFGPVDWTTLGTLDFEPPDLDTFRCLDLAYEAGRAGGTAPAVLSGANEVAVEAFLAGRIRGRDRGNGRRSPSGGTGNADEVADVLDADRSRAAGRRRDREPTGAPGERPARRIRSSSASAADPAAHDRAVRRRRWSSPRSCSRRRPRSSA